MLPIIPWIISVIVGLLVIGKFIEDEEELKKEIRELKEELEKEKNKRMIPKIEKKMKDGEVRKIEVGFYANGVLVKKAEFDNVSQKVFDCVNVGDTF